MKIVVIDNDPLVLFMIQQWFSLKGHTVLTYSSPLECPLYCGTGCPCTAGGPCPDIVISDYDMPKVTGYDFIKHLHDHGCRCADRSAIITGHCLHEEDLARLSTFKTRLFPKPVTLKELESWMLHVLSGASDV